MGHGKVASLHIYPVKGLRGIELTTSPVEHRGLRYDRRWVITDQSGEFISQRSHSGMARISTAIVGGTLVLTAPTGSWIAVPLEPSPGEEATVTVWDSAVTALPVDALADEWLSEFLGLDCRLYRMPNTTSRLIPPSYSAGQGIVSFADAMPLLCTTTGSLAELNRQLDEPVPMNRFRPNVVLEGEFEPFEEDDWSKVKLGDQQFFATKNCGRCLVTATDQVTGERSGEEPLRTLSRLHKIGQSAVFGRYLIPDREGSVAVGDEITILEASPQQSAVPS